MHRLRVKLRSASASSSPFIAKLPQGYDATVGERVNLDRSARGRGGEHHVIHADADGVTLRHAVSGAEKRLTHEQFHAAMARAHGKDFERGAERLLRRYVEAAQAMKSSPADAEASYKELRARFRAAHVDEATAKRLVGFLAARPGWEDGAKKRLLTLASDPHLGKAVASRGMEITKASENIAKLERAKNVKPRHVTKAVALRLPKGGFSARLRALQHQANIEAERTAALLGAIAAAGGHADVRRALIEHAKHAVLIVKLAQHGQARSMR